MSKTDEAGVRTFVAVELPSQVREELGALQSRFPSSEILKWVSPSLLHITVRFLGQIPPTRLPLVEQSAALAAASVSPFLLSFAGLGAFPQPRNPRVLWVGLTQDTGLEALQSLRGTLEEQLVAQGFPTEDRPFSPHITLARVRPTASSGERRALGEQFCQVARDTQVAGTFDVRELTVMRSDLGPRGPTYTAMAKYRLGSGTID